MNDKADHLSEPNPTPDHNAGAIPFTSQQARFFQRTDWLSFGVTAALVLMVYLFTLAPNVTLEFSGIFSVGAMYAGVPHPPGYPLWTVYSWLFTVFLPFSNIAWRVAFSSAVAGALACGTVALMVSRGGAMIVEGIPGLDRLKPKEGRALRVVSGYVAGTAFGFDGGFWRKAVVVDPWPLSLLLFSTVLCLLMKWLSAPDRKRYLYAASLVYGLTITNSQALLAAAPGLQALVMLGDRRLIREICFANAIVFVASRTAARMGYLDFIDAYDGGGGILRPLCFLVGVGSMVTAVVLSVRTRRLLTEWRPVFVCGLLFLLATGTYFYVPIASMTNPPVNWSYPRTVEGFFHLVIRGQYEVIQPTESFGRLTEQIRMYVEITVSEFGLFYLLIALIPFCFLRRMRAQERRWMLGILAVYVCLVFLLMVALNPSADRHSRETCKVFFSASHLLLAVWTGYGLALLGVLFARQAAPTSGPSPTCA